jgi:hypothetical protein
MRPDDTGKPSVDSSKPPVGSDGKDPSSGLRAVGDGSATGSGASASGAPVVEGTFSEKSAQFKLQVCMRPLRLFNLNCGSLVLVLSRMNIVC